jgi:hypothetical protein
MAEFRMGIPAKVECQFNGKTGGIEMATAQGSQEYPNGGAARAAAPPSAQPDMNSGKYSPEVIQRLLDQAALFNVFAIPHPQHSHAAIHTPGNARVLLALG